MDESTSPTMAAAQARIAAFRPAAYARTRNAIDGAVSGLSPYITHGLVSLVDVLAGVAARHDMDVQHKFAYDLLYAENGARYAPTSWHSPGSVIDASYESLDRLARHAASTPPGAALTGARRVRSVNEPHLAPWLARWAECVAAPTLFPPVPGRCDSFSQCWSRTSRGLQSAADLLAVNEVPAW